MSLATAVRACAVLSLLLVAAPREAAAQTACDRACLRGFIDDYFEALSARDLGRLPLAENVKLTENGRVLDIGGGLWMTAGAPFDYRDYVLDPETGQAAALSAIHEHGAVAQTFVRLKIVNRVITEIETLAVRAGDQRWFAPQNLDKLSDIFARPVPRSERATRDELIAAADAYFTAIETEGTPAFVQAPFGPGVKRYENGLQTTMNDVDPVLDRHRLSPEEQLERAFYKGITVTDRRYPVVDTEHGTVLAVGMFRREGPDTPVLLLAEVFKVTAGKIREIRAVILNLPNGAGTGWTEQTRIAGSSGARQPGSTFKDCRRCPEMIVLPGGRFTMGSPSDEPLRRDNEPQQAITIAPFAMGAAPVTWDEWEACVRDGACDGAGVDIALRTRNDGEPNPDYRDFGRGTRPVVGVSWYDAQAFVGWLNAKSGADDAYRLPSEAEWEYAARAGSTTAFPWGAGLDHDYGNFGVEAGGLGGKAEGRDRWVDETSPVGSFPPNAFGLYDMHGNIFEWTEDCYEADRAHAPADGSANKEGNCANRVFRSGTFLSNPYMQRSARRGAPYPATQRGRNYLGFRVAKTLD